MKSIEEIYQEMLRDFENRSGMDFSNSCDLAVRLYAVAAQIQALSIQTEWVKKQCFPQSAEGEYLTYHAQMRGLERRPAAKAVGSIAFSVRAPAEEEIVIPKGTVCISTGDVHFETTEENCLRAGEHSVLVPARAAVAGESGNTAASTILSMSVAPVGIVSCTNPQPFTGGADEEGDESLRERILDSFRRLPNGANAAFYETEALLQKGVAAAKAVGRPRGIGTVDVYITAAAGLPDEELLHKVKTVLQEKREIAVDLKVCAPAEKRIDIQVGLEPENAAEYETVKALVEQKLHGYFTGARLGEDVYLSTLHSLLHGIEGLRNYRILQPTADTQVRVGELPVLGGLTVTPVA